MKGSVELSKMLWSLALFALVLGYASRAFAIDQIVLEADEIAAHGARASNVAVILNVAANPAPTLSARIKQVRLVQPVGNLRELALDCMNLVVKEPLFACRAAHVTIAHGPAGPVDARAFAAYQTDSSLLKFGVSKLAIAGGVVRIEGSMGEQSWALQSQASGLQVKSLRALVKPWLGVPEGIAIEGTLTARFQASGAGKRIRFDGEIEGANFGFSNEEGTVAAEKVAASLRVKGTRSGKTLSIDVRALGSSGQALAGPVLLDFGTNPLNLQFKGALQDRNLEIDSLSIEQKNLLQARANGRATLGGDAPMLEQAHVEMERLQFPAAYTSLAQLTLATTDFGQLKTSGTASGVLDIEKNRPKRVALQLDGIELDDVKGKFSMADVRGDVHWAEDSNAQVPASFLSWSRGSAYGLSGGSARIDFRAQAFDVVLTRESRLPIFDGAILIRSLVLRSLGQPNTEMKFDAQIEPISMPLVSKAFGWPELQGAISGRVPGLSFRNKELTVEGDLSAAVFDGTIVGRNFRLRDPLGPWPRLFADVTARSLDLDLVTRAFPIGNITGRLDTDIQGLELFNWSPVAFDAKLYTTPGDRSKHLISQKAVTSISNVGGGGGGVTAALQSGVLRFFDDFRYDRIGLACRLRNDVCTMAGVEPAGMGYYIVKGKGLPRIDIIGNQGRVDWPRLVSQIEAGMRSNVIVQ